MKRRSPLPLACRRGVLTRCAQALVLLSGVVGCSSNKGAASPVSAGAQAGDAGSPSSAGASGVGGGAAGDGAAGSGGSVGAGAAAGEARWIGRVDLSDPTAPKFAWSGSGLVATVNGTDISVSLRSDGGSDAIFFTPVVDGTAGDRFSVAQSEGAKTVSLASGLAAGDHTVELYRDTEGKSSFAYSTFLGFTAGTPGAPPAASGRLLEIVGDSISAGYGDLGSEQHPGYGPDPSGGCRFSTDTESAYLTYGALAARQLGADASIIAASGWGIYSDNLGNTNDVLPAIYAGTVGGRATPAWDFVAQPQAVVINLGTNDFSANMSLDSASFTDAYNAFLATVRAKYPDAWIYCAFGPLLYGTGLTNARKYIQALVASANTAGDAKVKTLDLGSQNSSLGTGCDYHPNVTEHQRLAGILVTRLRGDLSW